VCCSECAVAQSTTTGEMADTNATSPAFSVEVACGGGNDYDGRIGLRVSSIFVIGFGSFLGISSGSILLEDF